MRRLAVLALLGALPGCATFEHWIGWGPEEAAQPPAQAVEPPPPPKPKTLAEAAGDRVFFDYRDGRLGPTGLSVIARQARWLRNHPTAVVTITGHADDGLDWREGARLAYARAEAVRRALIAAGIAAHRLSITQFADQQPFTTSTTEAGRALNRRAVTAVAPL